MALTSSGRAHAGSGDDCSSLASTVHVKSVIISHVEIPILELVLAACLLVIAVSIVLLTHHHCSFSSSVQLVVPLFDFVFPESERAPLLLILCFATAVAFPAAYSELAVSKLVGLAGFVFDLLLVLVQW